MDVIKLKLPLKKQRIWTSKFFSQVFLKNHFKFNYIKYLVFNKDHFSWKFRCLEKCHTQHLYSFTPGRRHQYKTKLQVFSVSYIQFNLIQFDLLTQNSFLSNVYFIFITRFLAIAEIISEIKTKIIIENNIAETLSVSI